MKNNEKKQKKFVTDLTKFRLLTSGETIAELYVLSLRVGKGLLERAKVAKVRKMNKHMPYLGKRECNSVEFIHAGFKQRTCGINAVLPKDICHNFLQFLQHQIHIFRVEVYDAWPTIL